MMERTLVRDDGLNFIFPLPKAEEQSFLNRCAKAYLAAGRPPGFYYNRARSMGATGISMHFDDPLVARQFMAAVSSPLLADGIELSSLPIISDENRLIGEVFGGIDNATLYREFSAEACPTLMDWLLHCEGSQAKIRTVAMEVLINYLFLAHEKLPALRGEKIKTAYPGAFVSFKSHFEAFAATCDNPAAVRQEFDGRYAAVAPHIRAALVRYANDGLDDATPAWMEQWLDLLKERLTWTYDAIHQQRLVGSAGGDGGKDRNLMSSAFHRKMFDSKEFIKHGMRDPVFQCNRVLLGMIYLTLFRLGLPMIERYFLCYAISRSVSEHFDVSAERAFARGLWRSRVRRLLNIVRFN